MSDPAVAPIIDDAPVYAAAFSRLTNTDGRMVIEGPPSGPIGRFYELHEQFKTNTNKDFQVFHVTIYDARDNGLVTQAFIDEKKLELGPLFAQTYEASFDIGVGNVFDNLDIDRAIEIGDKIEMHIPEISPYNLLCLGLDPGWGSSPTGLCLCEHIKDKGIVMVRQTMTFVKNDPNYVKDVIFDMYRRYWNLWVVIDGSNRAMVNILKSTFNESLDWDPKSVSPDNMKIIPIAFNRDHEQMLQKLHLFLNKRYLGIPKKHQDLIRSLRTAQAIGYKLDKQKTINSDLLDALRLSLYGYNIR